MWSLPDSRELVQTATHRMDTQSASVHLPQSWSPALCLLARLISGQADRSARLDDGEWAEFVTLVIERHRLAPPVVAAAHDAGIPFPAPVMAALNREAAANVAQLLRQKAETVRILRLLGEYGCRPAVLKGWPLAESLFSADAGRHAKDLDLYIDASEIGTAVASLTRLGYEIDSEHQARVQFIADPSFQREFNDLSLVNPDRDVQVELHWRSYHFRGWTDLRDIPGTWTEISIDGSGVMARVPSPTANLIYLSLHGQQHLWLRLKWLLDIRRCLLARSEADLVSDLAVARIAGAGRAVVTAVHLAARVLSAPLPRDWPALDSVGERAIRRFLQMIGDAGSAPGARNARIQFYWTSLCMAESLSQRLGVLRYGLWRRLRFAAASRGAVGG